MRVRASKASVAKTIASPTHPLHAPVSAAVMADFMATWAVGDSTVAAVEVASMVEVAAADSTAEVAEVGPMVAAVAVGSS